MNQNKEMLYASHVMLECERQWKDNQEEFYGKWSEQSNDEKIRYYMDMYQHLHNDYDEIIINMECYTDMKADKLESMKNIGYIVYNGYYLHDDDNDRLYPHTDLTRDIYNRGLAACGELTDDEIMYGVYFENGKAYATVDCDKVFEFEI